MLASIYFILAVICFMIICVYGILKKAGHVFEDTSKWLIAFCFVLLFEFSFFAVYENHKQINNENTIHITDIEMAENITD